MHLVQRIAFPLIHGGLLVHRKALFLCGVAVSLVVAQSYFYTHLVVGVALGTVLATFVTSIVKYPNASLENSFFMASGWLLISYGMANFLPDTASSAAIAFVSYLILIRAIYRPPKLLPIVMLATLSTIFRKSIALIALWPATDFVYGVIFW